MKNNYLKISLCILFLVLCFTTFFLEPRNINAQTSSFRFVSWADTKTAVGVLTSLSQQVVTLDPRFTIFEGDLEDTGFTQIGMDAWKNAVNGGANNGLFNKTLPVRGNHDSANTLGWQTYFNTAAVATAVGVTNYRELNADLSYSFDYGNSHFIGIDVVGDAAGLSTAQLTWMDNDLTLAEGRGLTHAFIYFHGPIYCVAEHCSDTISLSTFPANSTRDLFIKNIINKHPIVSATFHGHEHTYTYVHIDASRVTGVTHPFEEFVTGDAGAGPAGCAKTFRFDYCMASHGFTTIDVSGNNFTVNFYKQGIAAPVKTFVFNKTVSPSPTPTSTPSPTTIPTIPPTSTPTPIITVTPLPTTIPGDSNRDNKVDEADYQTWFNFYTLTTINGYLEGDYNLDHKVDGLDYVIWLNNYSI